MEEKADQDGPLVSVLIPTYNMAQYLESAIDSVLRGTFERLEALVVDDGSKDNTREIVRAYMDKRSTTYDARVRYERQSNTGKSGAVNRGIELSRGAYITILDADDQLTRDSLQLRYDAVQKEGADLAIGEFEVFDDTGMIVGSRSTPRTVQPSEIYRRFYRASRSPFHLNACLFSRGLCERVGPFDRQLLRCQDIDYSIRLLKTARRIAWINEPVYRYWKYRTTFLERARLRKKTLLHRPRVYWKNYDGWHRFVAVVTGVVFDTAKLLYEVTGNYKE